MTKQWQLKKREEKDGPKDFPPTSYIQRVEIHSDWDRATDSAK